MAMFSLCFCWQGYLLCPILMEYENSGDFTVAARLRFSLRRNAVPGYHVLRGADSNASWVLLDPSHKMRSGCHDENGEGVHLRGNHHLCYGSICACT